MVTVSPYRCSAVSSPRSCSHRLFSVLLGVCLRRYNPDTRLRAWRADRPYRSGVFTLLFGTGAAFVLVALFDSLTPNLPWYEYLWTAYLSLWVAWLLGLRAAAIEQLSYEPASSEC